jgi:CheY-like chemotaxis protein
MYDGFLFVIIHGSSCLPQVRHSSSALGTFMGKKILVADGSPAARKAAESLLKRQGYEVLYAEDGTSALDIIKNKQLHLIFLDVSLPIVDGRHICEELKGDSKLKDIPVIMLSDKTQMDKEKALRQVGADAFMRKPFNPKDILKNVEKFLKKENTSLKTQNSGSKDKTETHPERKKSRNELVPGDEKSGIDKLKMNSASPEKEKKKDSFLDILETSAVLESLEAPSSDSDAEGPHGFDWFMSEMKKESEEAGKVDLGTKKESKEKPISAEITSFTHEDSRKKDKDEKKAPIYQIDEDQKGYEDFLNELQNRLEEPKVEKSLDHKIPSLDHDKMIQALIESISSKVAQEVVKKIDPEILRQMVRDELEKFRKDKVKAR